MKKRIVKNIDEYSIYKEIKNVDEISKEVI